MKTFIGLLIILSLLLFSSVGEGSTAPTQCQENDGNPKGVCTTIKFPDGTLSKSGSIFTYSGGGVAETDPVYSANTFATGMDQGVATADSPSFTGLTVASQSVCLENGTNCPVETDPVVGAISGLVKADGAGNISAAVAGTDYVATEADTLDDVTNRGAITTTNITVGQVQSGSDGFDGKYSAYNDTNTVDGSTAFVDSSSSVQTITTEGNAQVDTAQSKFGGTSLSTSGSPTTNRLTAPDGTDFEFGSGAFTIDFWFRFDGSVTVDGIAPIVKTASGQRSWQIFLLPVESEIEFNYSTDGTTVITAQATGVTFVADTWYHIAIVRTTSDLYFFQDGVLVGSTGFSGVTLFDSPQVVQIRASASGGPQGWIDEVRIVKGTAVWTSNFNVPTREYQNNGTTISDEYSYGTDTKLMLHMGHLDRIQSILPSPQSATSTDFTLPVDAPTVTRLLSVFPSGALDYDNSDAPLSIKESLRIKTGSSFTRLYFGSDFDNYISLVSNEITWNQADGNWNWAGGFGGDYNVTLNGGGGGSQFKITTSTPVDVITVDGQSGSEKMTLGSNGIDGKLSIYSEQGGTDYTASLNPNSAMTSDADFYLPADEPAGTYLLNMTTGGVIGFDSNTYLTSVTLATDTTGDYVASITAGAGLASTGATTGENISHTLSTASSEADFLASGALTCGAGTQGKIQVHTTPLQYCDNAGTPALQYTAYGDSSGQALSGDSATSFFTTGTIEDARLSTNVIVAGDTFSGDVTGTLEADGDTPLTIAANSVALTTDTTGNYAAGDAEAGNALTGDSATAFFSVGQIESARGGTGQDFSASTGVIRVSGGTFSADATLSNLSTPENQAADCTSASCTATATCSAGKIVITALTSTLTSTCDTDPTTCNGYGSVGGSSVSVVADVSDASVHAVCA